MSIRKLQTANNDNEKIINEFLPFIKYTAYRLSRQLPPHITIDDLISVGLIGLMGAVEKFKPGKAKLKSYADIRIKGAMIDELRTATWMPRSTRKRGNEINKARADLERKLGRTPDDHELAEAMKLPLYDYFKMIQYTASSTPLRLEDSKPNKYDDGDMSLMECIEDPYAKSSFTLLEEKDRKENLMKLLDTLPEQYKLVLSLYYLEELTMKDIGKVLNVTESRVCQIRTEAIDELRGKINQLYDLVA